MKKSRYTETQIIAMLKEHESGKRVVYICRENGISQATFFNWKGKYCGLEINELKRLRELEEENTRLKKMYSDVSMDHQILKEVLSKKGWGPSSKKT